MELISSLMLGIIGSLILYILFHSADRSLEGLPTRYLHTWAGQCFRAHCSMECNPKQRIKPREICEEELCK